jgi:hypothetical protein
MCLAPTRHVAKVRLSIHSPYRVVIPRITPEYQYPWFCFYCASLFPACWMLQPLIWRVLRDHCPCLPRCRPQTQQPSPSPQDRWRQPRALPQALTSTSPPPPSLRLPTSPTIPATIFPPMLMAPPLLCMRAGMQTRGGGTTTGLPTLNPCPDLTTMRCVIATGIGGGDGSAELPPAEILVGRYGIASWRTCMSGTGSTGSKGLRRRGAHLEYASWSKGDDGGGSGRTSTLPGARPCRW